VTRSSIRSKTSCVQSPQQSGWSRALRQQVVQYRLMLATARIVAGASATAAGAEPRADRAVPSTTATMYGPRLVLCLLLICTLFSITNPFGHTDIIRIAFECNLASKFYCGARRASVG